MTLLDILIAVPLCWLIFLGWKRGLVREVTTLAGVLVGLWASIHLAKQVAPKLGIDGESAVLVAFIVVFLVALVATYLLGKAVEGLMHAVKLSVVNRLLGALIGAAKALIIIATLLNFIVMIDSNEMLLKHDVKTKSVLYGPVFKTGNKLTAQLKEYIVNHKDEWKEALQ